MSRGFGKFLSGYEVRPAFTNDKFRGWKLVAVRTPEAPTGPLRPGDTLLRVNGRTLERPDDALAAWQSMALASEVRLTYDHEGQVHEFAAPIFDEPKTPGFPVAR